MATVKVGRLAFGDRATHERRQSSLSPPSRVSVPDAATAKIRLFINYEHIALVMRVRRELGIGEGVA